MKKLIKQIMSESAQPSAIRQAVNEYFDQLGSMQVKATGDRLAMEQEVAEEMHSTGKRGRHLPLKQGVTATGHESIHEGGDGSDIDQIGDHDLSSNWPRAIRKAWLEDMEFDSFDMAGNVDMANQFADEYNLGIEFTSCEEADDELIWGVRKVTNETFVESEELDETEELDEAEEVDEDEQLDEELTALIQRSGMVMETGDGNAQQKGINFDGSKAAKGDGVLPRKGPKAKTTGNTKPLATAKSATNVGQIKS